jgi:lipoprotein signal peptidase
MKMQFKGSYSLPAFNIADCSIIVGVIVMLVNTFLQERPTSENRSGEGL